MKGSIKKHKNLPFEILFKEYSEKIVYKIKKTTTTIYDIQNIFIRRNNSYAL